MAQYNTSSTLSALWKEIYGDSVDKLIPEASILGKKIKFETADKVGDKYVVPVMLSHEHGVTYLGQNAGVATLNNSVAASYAEAQVQPSETLLRAAISYNSADRMMSNKQAFLSWSQMLVENMTASLAKRLEIDYLYGQVGIGAVGSVSASSTTAVITISDASWADGIWAGMEGASLDIFDTTLATKRTANAAAVISTVDFANKQITVTGNATDMGNVAATDKLFFYGSYAVTPTHYAMAGVDKIVTNSGSLFNISASTYGLWAGNSYSAGSAALTLGKIFNGVSQAVARGLQGKILVLVSPRTFANLNSDQSALRRYGVQSSKGENGFESLQFYSGNGAIEVVSHIYVKQGEAFGIPLDCMKRLGTSDITFKLPNAAAGGDIFLHIPDKSGYEVRCRASLALFCDKPSRMVKWTNITNA